MKLICLINWWLKRSLKPSLEVFNILLFFFMFIIQFIPILRKKMNSLTNWLSRTCCKKSSLKWFSKVFDALFGFIIFSFPFYLIWYLSFQTKRFLNWSTVCGRTLMHIKERQLWNHKFLLIYQWKMNRTFLKKQLPWQMVFIGCFYLY